MKAVFTVYVLLVIATPLPAGAALPVHAVAARSCSASPVLNAIGDALTSGSDAKVLSAALAGEEHLASCGAERDVIGAEMIAADAYGDTNHPVQRCRALRDAATRAAKLGDSARVRLISGALRGCKE